jgi:putative selenium metabolism hydrolase
MLDEQGLIAFTQELVRAVGLSGKEQSAAQCVEAEMRQLGYDHVEVDALGNVVGLISGAGAGPTILLDAHTDTVGISPGIAWTYPAYGGEIHPGKAGRDAIYGRGSADMKGALAAMVHAAASLDRATLRGRVVVSASTMEEVLEGVALRPIMERYPPDVVIIGEPSALNLVHGGRGRAELHLTTTGIPSHSSAPHLGRNAVLDMMQVIHAIEDMALPSDPLLGPAIIALTDIVSDPYPGNSVIPSQCRVTYDRRLITGETSDQVLEQIRTLPGVQGIDLDVRIGLGEYTAWTGTVAQAEKFFPAWTLDAQHPIVQRALEALQGIGQQPKLATWRFCTNAAWSAGELSIPTIGYGPADEPDIHIVDEHLPITDLIAAAEGYRAIIGALASQNA